MVIFITSLKKGAIRNPDFRTIFGQTIDSVDSQECKDFKIIVVVDADDREFLNDNRIIVVSVNFLSEYNCGRFWRDEGIIASMNDIKLRVDRGCKYAIGVSEARNFDPDYIVFFDCDDLISRYLAGELLAVKPKQGWCMTSGYIMYNNENKIYLLKDFNRYCGTCYAIRSDMLDFPGQYGKVSQDDVLDRLGAQYVMRVLGSHRYLDKFFELTGQNRPFSIYRVDNGFNHVGYRRVRSKPILLPNSIRHEFDIW